MLPVSRLLHEIRPLIDDARRNALIAINSELASLYWKIGTTIKQEILKDEKPAYGKHIIKNLSIQLNLEYGRGFNNTNLWLFVRFASMFPDYEKIYAVRKEFTWTHFRIFMGIESELERQFYMEMCRIERWSTRELQGRIDSALFLRTAISKQHEEIIKSELNKLHDSGELQEDFVLKDPAVLDFLGLKEVWNEKDLEDAILRELQSFILEMGSGFAFVARQKRITIDGEDFKIDLLFYHRHLKRLVAIDLKMRKFRPGDKSQMELYLRWLDKYERTIGEEEPIGLILCAGKSEEQIELLMLDKGNIKVAKYLTELPPKDILQTRLHEMVLKARSRKKVKD
jgi:predicted nuclease of restriction endonuclease-like (RecB) superfamily